MSLVVARLQASRCLSRSMTLRVFEKSLHRSSIRLLNTSSRSSLISGISPRELKLATLRSQIILPSCSNLLRPLRFYTDDSKATPKTTGGEEEDKEVPNLTPAKASKVEQTNAYLLQKKLEDSGDFLTYDRILKIEREEKKKEEEDRIAKGSIFKRAITAQFWKDIWGGIVHEVVRFKVGFQLLWTDMKVATGLMQKVLQGNVLSRRERLQFKRTLGDMFRLIPFSVFVIVPFAEFALPFCLKLFPDMLPSTFQESKTEREKTKAELKMKLEMAKFLQETVEEMAVVKKGESDQTSKALVEFANFLDKGRKNQNVTTADIVKYSKLFRDELTLDNLSRPQLVALCRLLSIQAIGTTNMLRFQIRLKLRDLHSDDLLIHAEGVNSLTVEELQTACRQRGMRSLGLTKDALQQALQQWIDLHIREGVPSSLLLLSRVIYVQDNVLPSNYLQSVITSMPEEVIAQAKAEILEREGSAVDLLTQLNIIKSEQTHIAKEQEEEQKEKIQKPHLTKGQHPEEDENTLTLEDVVDLAVAIVSLSDENADKRELFLLKKDVSEHKDDIKKLQEASEHKYVVPTGSARLSSRVEKMLAKLETTLSKLPEKDDAAFRKLDLDRDGYVSKDELVTALKALPNPPSEAKLNKIAAFLDSNNDGVLEMDTMKTVFKVLQAEGEDIRPKDLSLLVNLVNKHNSSRPKAKE